MRAFSGSPAGLLPLVAATVFLASPASAQITGVLGEQAISYALEVPTAVPNVSTTTSFAGSVPNGSAQFSSDVAAFPNIANYQVSTEVDNAAGYIAFANNSSSAGASSSVTTTTSIQVSYNNPTSQTVNPTLDSTILPGGFGVYVGSLANNPTLQNSGDGPFFLHKAPIVGDVNQTPETQRGTNLLSFPTDNASEAPTESLSFQILSGSTVVASYTASLVVYQNSNDSSVPPGELDPVLSTSFSTALNGFGLIPADDPTKAIGYAWNATEISVPLGDIAPGASSTLTYVTSVTTSQFEAENAYGDALVTYAGFGDPIGKKSGSGPINDPHFPVLELGLPQFTVDPNTGAVTLGVGGFSNVYTAGPDLVSTNLSAPGGPTVTDVPQPAAWVSEAESGAVPEPRSWALIALGAGLAGAALRRRPRQAGLTA